MKSILAILILSVIFVTTVDAFFKFDISKLDYLITYAQKAKKDQFPFQVHVETRNFESKITCGGALIDSQHVLTAAHCIKMPELGGGFTIMESAVVELGMIELNSTKKTVVKASQLLYHENYEGSENDIAIIRLDTPVNFSSSIGVAKARSKVIKPDTIALVSGWGSTRTKEMPFNVTRDDIMPNNLLFAEVKVISNEKCQEIYDEIYERSSIPRIIIGDERICAESVGDSGGPCIGDSGGPLSVGNNIIGLVESGITVDDLCIKDYPAVYTRISYYKKWIKNKLKSKVHL